MSCRPFPAIRRTSSIASLERRPPSFLIRDNRSLEIAASILPSSSNAADASCPVCNPRVNVIVYFVFEAGLKQSSRSRETRSWENSRARWRPATDHTDREVTEESAEIIASASSDTSPLATTLPAPARRIQSAIPAPSLQIEGVPTAAASTVAMFRLSHNEGLT